MINARAKIRDFNFIPEPMNPEENHYLFRQKTAIRRIWI